MKLLFMKCNEANLCCDKAQYEEATYFEKIKIHLHNFFCRPCKEYTDNNNKLTALIKKVNLKTCTEEEKKNWKDKIRKEASK